MHKLENAKIHNFFRKDQIKISSGDKSSHIEDICQNYGISKSETIFIGDSVSDIRSGHKAGVDTLAILDPKRSYNSPEELLKANPTHFIPKMDFATTWIRKDYQL